MAKPPNIRNILFDLGGVILDINIQSTLKKFYELGFPASLLQYPNSMNTDLFFKYETGKMNVNQFRDEIRKESGVDVSDKVFDEAWNSMLVGIPEERTNLLKALAERYALYMLSNTSDLHTPVFEKMFEETAGVKMCDLFTGIYYSHEIGFRKPDLEAWEEVIKKAGIRPEETLFLDDNIHNVKASQELGFQAIHIHERMNLMDLGFDL